MAAQLTLGPLLYHWPAEQRLDFYARIADEAAVDTVYLGEVICSKRAPFFDDHYLAVAERLQRGGKRVVFSSLCEVMLKRERNMVEAFSTIGDYEIEANDSSVLYHVSGRPHRIGTLMNLYNEEALAFYARRGATHVCLPAELPGTSVALMAARAKELGVGLEVQVFGRVSLAVSARCYHARAHGRVKDNCQFVCEDDPDGMELRTLSRQKFLSINGIQTLSHSYVDLMPELGDLTAMGVGHLRLSPHTLDMVAVASIFRDVLDGRCDAADGQARLQALGPDLSFSNGFWYGKAGYTRQPHARIGAA